MCGRGGSPGQRRAQGRGLGVGSGRPCPCPRGLPGRRLSARSGRAFCPRCGERRGGHGGLSSSHTRTRASPSLTHTRSHSLTHSLCHTLKQKGSAAQQPVPPRREEEGGDSRNTATAVAKTSRRLGLPPALASSPLRGGGPPPPGTAPRGPWGPGRVAADRSCRRAHHVGRPDSDRRPRLQSPECTGRRCGRPLGDSSPQSGNMRSVA